MKTIAAAPSHPTSPAPFAARTHRRAGWKARALLALAVGLGASTVLAEREASATPLTYGHAYVLQNGYQNWQGGYLDTRNAGCQGNYLCVSTAYGSTRDGNSGLWVITSADGKAAGTPVVAGDRIHLQNLWNNNGGYLDTRNSGCQGDLLCVSTSTSSARDGGSGTWKVVPSDPTVTGGIPEGMDIHLQNLWGGLGGYLDTRSSGCQGNDLCVATSVLPERDQNSTHWRLQGSTTDYHVSRSDGFCYDTLHPQVLLDNGVSVLHWNEYGNIVLYNKDDPAHATAWGVGSKVPLTGSTTAKVCMQSGVMTIWDSVGHAVWTSGPGPVANAPLALDRCTASITGSSWSHSTSTCNFTMSFPGWCKARPVGSNTQILWMDGTELVWQSDGNLVVYAHDDTFSGATWASNTMGTGQQLCYQNDGNFVIYDASSHAVWAANSVGSGALRLDEGGAHADYYSGSTRVEAWRTGASYNASMSLDNDHGRGWCRTTNAPGRLVDSGSAHLEWQPDGNLVLYKADGTPQVASNTDGVGAKLCFQSDGNLVVYNPQGLAVWAANSLGGNELTLVGCTAQISNPATGAVPWGNWSFNPCYARIPGGGFSFLFDKSAGNSDFGAEMWIVAGSTTAATLASFKASIPTGTQAATAVNKMLPALVSPDFAEVMGDAGVSATIFSHNLTLFEIGGYINKDESKCYITVAGSAMPCSLTLTLSQDVQLLEETRTIMLGGVVPVTVTAGVSGNISFSTTLTPTLVGLKTVITPSAGLSADASVALGVDGFDVGIGGSLDLVTVSAPVNLGLAFIGPRSYSASADLDETMLDGSLSLFADALFVHYKHELVSWDGLNYSQHLFDSSGSF